MTCSLTRVMKPSGKQRSNQCTLVTNSETPFKMFMKYDCNVTMETLKMYFCKSLVLVLLTSLLFLLEVSLKGPVNRRTMFISRKYLHYPTGLNQLPQNWPCFIFDILFINIKLHLLENYHFSHTCGVLILLQNIYSVLALKCCTFICIMKAIVCSYLCESLATCMLKTMYTYQILLFSNV